MKFHILTALCTIASALIATAQVPSLINYQGRLTNANGDPVTGSKNFAISIYDAATNGTLLYTETIGAVTLDSNGVYSFQFGSAGTSNKQVTETIGTTDGTTLVYSKALANSSVVNNSITVADGTNSWSQSVGNPGAGATATANTIVGFVIGATITNGGSGYTTAPIVTISGNGTGATATATLTDGVVTGINIVSAGSGYTTGATITIAPPVIPFRVEYASGTITATYASAPAAEQTIAASYRYGTTGITDALANNGEHWMAITVDGVTQGTRQRVLAVPFAAVSSRSLVALNVADRDVSIKPDIFFPIAQGNVLMLPLYSGFPETSTRCFTVIPSTFKYLKSIDFSYNLGYFGANFNNPPQFLSPPAISALKIELIKSSFTDEEILKSIELTSTSTNKGDFTTSLLVNQQMSPSIRYWIRVTATNYRSSDPSVNARSILKDLRINATE